MTSGKAGPIGVAFSFPPRGGSNGCVAHRGTRHSPPPGAPPPKREAERIEEAESAETESSPRGGERACACPAANSRGEERGPGAEGSGESRSAAGARGPGGAGPGEAAVEGPLGRAAAAAARAAGKECGGADARRSSSCCSCCRRQSNLDPRAPDTRCLAMSAGYWREESLVTGLGLWPELCGSSLARADQLTEEQIADDDCEVKARAAGHARSPDLFSRSPLFNTPLRTRF
ncbi:hypothetical protein ACRRTK_000852 [Alexandromys fortis]